MAALVGRQLCPCGVPAWRCVLYTLMGLACYLLLLTAICAFALLRDEASAPVVPYLPTPLEFGWTMQRVPACQVQQRHGLLLVY